MVPFFVIIIPFKGVIINPIKIINNKIGQNILINIGISDQYVNNKYEHGTITINNNPSNKVIVPLLINDNHLFL